MSNGGSPPDPSVTVLALVEDNADMRMLIRVLLGRDPRLVLEGQAETAEEAIELVASMTPGLIILDHGLKGSMTGLEAAPLMKARAPLAKILLFSAYDLDREAAREAAVDGFLRKDRIMRLLPTAQALLGLTPLEDAE